MPRYWSRSVALALSLSAGATCLPVVAQVVSQALSFNLPAGPLAETLNSIARQSGRGLSLDASLLGNRQAPAIKGSMSAEAAMSQALVGSGYALRVTDSGNFSVQPVASGALEVGVTTIDSVTDQAAGEPINPPTTVGSRAPLTARELPQSVSVVSHAQLEAEKIVDLQQALHKAPGIVATNVDTSRYRFYSRGFEIDNLQIDGVQMPFTYLTPPNMAMFEQVEVLRGPAGLYNGAGGAGGTINLVTKRPTAQFAGEAQVSAGTYDTRMQRIDLGGPLNEQGTLRGRVVAENDTRDLRADGTHRDVQQYYAVLEADVSPDTTVTAGVSHQAFESKSMQYGYPTYTDGSFLNVSASTFYGPDWNKETYDQTMAFAELKHDFANEWSSKLSVNNNITDRYSIFGGLRGAVNPATNLTQYQTSESDSHTLQTSIDLSAWGPLQVFGRTHQLTLGTSWLKESATAETIPGTPRTITVDLDNPPTNIAPISVPTSKASRATTDTLQRSVYANARWSLADALTLITGARVSWWESSVDPDASRNSNGSVHSADSLSHHVTPYGGLIYDLNDTYSLYASYTDIFKPQSLRDTSGSLLKPLQGSQYEVGIKGSYLDGAIDASAAVFQLTQENRGILDPADSTNTYYLAQGKARSRGLELQMSGRVTPRWDLGAGYSYTSTRYFDASADTGKSAFSAYTPRHLLKLWSHYRLPEPLQDLSINLSSYTTSEISTNTSGVIVRQPGYTTVDAGLSYRINPHLTADLNVTNVFDRYYYQSIQTPSDHNYLGDPRLTLMSLKYTF